MKYINEIRRAIKDQLHIYVNTTEGHHTGIAAEASNPELLKLITNEGAIWIPLHQITHVSSVLTFRTIKKGCS